MMLIVRQNRFTLLVCLFLWLLLFSACQGGVESMSEPDSVEETKEQEFGDEIDEDTHNEKELIPDENTAVPKATDEANMPDTENVTVESENSLVSQGSILGETELAGSAFLIQDGGQFSLLDDRLSSKVSLKDITNVLESGKEILVIFGDLQGTGGYSIELNNITHESGEITVEASVLNPPPDMMLEQAQQTPYAIFAVDPIDDNEAGEKIINLDLSHE